MKERATNRYRVPRKEWQRWNELQRRVFNDIYEWSMAYGPCSDSVKQMGTKEWERHVRIIANFAAVRIEMHSDRLEYLAIKEAA